MSKGKKDRKRQPAERTAAARPEQVTETVAESSTAAAMPGTAQKKREKKFGHN